MLGSSLCEYMGLQPEHVRVDGRGRREPGHHAAARRASHRDGCREDRARMRGRESRDRPRSRRGRRHAHAGRPSAIRAALWRIDPGLLRDGRPPANARVRHDARATRRRRREHARARRCCIRMRRCARRSRWSRCSRRSRSPIRFAMLDCCLVSDCAGAFIVTSAERARDLRHKPAYLLGIGEKHTHEHVMCAPSLTHFGAARIGTHRLRHGRRRPDATSTLPSSTTVSRSCRSSSWRSSGFVERGDGGAFFEDGHARDRRQAADQHPWRDAVARARWRGGRRSSASSNRCGSFAAAEGERQVRTPKSRSCTTKEASSLRIAR